MDSSFDERLSQDESLPHDITCMQNFGIPTSLPSYISQQAHDFTMASLQRCVFIAIAISF